jgi:hypothetical protein
VCEFTEGACLRIADMGYESAGPGFFAAAAAADLMIKGVD